MSAILGFMAVVMLVLWLAPQSPAGRALNRALVEWPMARLAGLERHHLIFVVLMAGFMLGGSELLALMGPEMFGAFVLDLSIYFDAVIVTYALSTLAAARRSGSWLKHVALQRLRKPRPRSKRPACRVRPDRKPSNDDEPHPAVSVLAA